MKVASWNALRGYTIAIAVVVVTCLIWLSSTLLIGNRVSSSFFLMAIVVTNRLAGRRPSWLALVLGAIPVTCSQYTRSGLFDLGGTTIIVVYLLLGTILNCVMQSERVARQIAERSAQEAFQKQQLLEKEITEQGGRAGVTPHRDLAACSRDGSTGTSGRTSAGPGCGPDGNLELGTVHEGGEMVGDGRGHARLRSGQIPRHL